MSAFREIKTIAVASSRVHTQIGRLSRGSNTGQ